jgi:hypothetical protein
MPEAAVAVDIVPQDQVALVVAVWVDLDLMVRKDNLAASVSVAAVAEQQQHLPLPLSHLPGNLHVAALVEAAQL